MRKERKHYTAEEKVAVLRRHLLDKVPVSDLCEELSLKPTVFYRWQIQHFRNSESLVPFFLCFLQNHWIFVAVKKPADVAPRCLIVFF